MTVDQIEEPADTDEANDPSDPSDPSEATAASDTTTAAAPRWRRFVLPAAAALVFAVGVFLWWSAATDEQLSQAEVRDEVLIAATHHIETMNTLDYREVDAGLEAWMDVTTGTLHDQLAQVGDDERQLLADQKKISTGKVVDSAVFSLDGDTATVVASVEVTVKDDADPDAEPTLKRNRFSADAVKVGDQWLLENLQQVAVNLS
ncbi:MULTISPECIES: nuclear transport factor 2 family protein [Mumia]|uniref:nuclear transport factor 2 family protein n=1 Tax=Mumia TaxID=1546255 RepID=UPI001420F634|nr:nuclear transport factor 2 family protein [Mumia sp. ZJ430]